MLATSVFGGRRLSRAILTSCSFHSALKRQLKADQKAKEKEAKLAAAAATAETNKVSPWCATHPHRSRPFSLVLHADHFVNWSGLVSQAFISTGYNKG